MIKFTEVIPFKGTLPRESFEERKNIKLVFSLVRMRNFFPTALQNGTEVLFMRPLETKYTVIRNESQYCKKKKNEKKFYRNT